MARTSVTFPESMKEQMKKVDVNWKEGVREVIARKLEEECEMDVVQAFLINERLRWKAPEGWDSAKVIGAWRRRRS